MLEVCSSFSLIGVSNKNSGGPVASRIKCKFFVNSSLISSACLSYLVIKCTSMFHSFVVFAYTVPFAWKSWNLSQPPPPPSTWKPPTHLQDSTKELPPGWVLSQTSQVYQMTLPGTSIGLYTWNLQLVWRCICLTSFTSFYVSKGQGP